MAITDLPRSCRATEGDQLLQYKKGMQECYPDKQANTSKDFRSALLLPIGDHSLPTHADQSYTIPMSDIA